MPDDAAAVAEVPAPDPAPEPTPRTVGEIVEKFPELPADEVLRIEVDHDAYYRRIPIREEELPRAIRASDGATVYVTDVRGESARGGTFEDTDGNTRMAADVIDSTFPGFLLKKIVVQEPATSVTGVHIPNLKKINADRKAAGLGRRPHHVNLAQHLADGPWERHFPLESITDIRCDDPQWETWLRGHFFEEED